jgi:hypothetical protein
MRLTFQELGVLSHFSETSQIYLVEVKWTADPCPEAELLVFLSKVTSKSRYTRGIFISVNGISKSAAAAIVKGKQPSFFVVDGYDLMMVLEDNINLVDFLRQRQRLLGEGEMMVPFIKLRRS